MKDTTAQKLARRKRRIAKRLDAARRWTDQPRPMLAARAGRNIRYQVADRARAIACGGIGAIHLLARRVGLIQAIDAHVKLLKRHLPYHESDHVLSLAYNVLAGGTCIEDLGRLRSDEAYLDALGAQRIPDPTTAGDFCRRFENEPQVLSLMETINQTRLTVWRQQQEEEPEFFDRAVLDADGTIAPTTGACKAGMDISYDGQWGYHPLLVSLANTKEPLYLVNRSGNRPATSAPTSTWIRPSRSAAAARGSGRSCSAATPTSCRPGSWTSGTPPATSPSSSGPMPASR